MAGKRDEYVCCFCAEVIPFKTDQLMQMTLEQYKAAPGAGEQIVWAHIPCFRERIHPDTPFLFDQEINQEEVDRLTEEIFEDADFAD